MHHDILKGTFFFLATDGKNSASTTDLFDPTRGDPLRHFIVPFTCLYLIESILPLSSLPLVIRIVGFVFNLYKQDVSYL